MEPLVRFIHLSDTHLGPTEEYVQWEVKPSEAFERVRKSVQALPFNPDFILHTGDVVNDPDERAYAHAQKVFGAFRIPCYFVAGNHDSPDMMHEFLREGDKENFPTAGRRNFAFERSGVRFFVLDLRSTRNNSANGSCTVAERDILQAELSRGREPVCVCIHYPCIAMDSPWIEREMIVENGEEVHALLCKFGPRLRGVFYGHVHAATQTYRDGIWYSSVASTFRQLQGWPNKDTYQLNPERFATYNVVSIYSNSTVVKQVEVNLI